MKDKRQIYCVQLEPTADGGWPPVIRVRADGMEREPGRIVLKLGDEIVGMMSGNIAAWWIECPPTA